jgi:hypothetical protein
LNTKPEANLEASFDKTTSWDISKSTAHCQGSWSDCPLKEKSGFVIYNKSIFSGIFASINGVHISDFTLAPNYMSVMFDDALVGCGSAKECTIDIVSPKGAIYGSVVVDMDNKMKILRVNAPHSSEIVIQQIDTFNAIEMSYFNNIKNRT